MQPNITPHFANGLEMLLATVQAMPEQPAMYYFDRTISYRELDRTSSALAFALKTRGIGLGDRIALYLQNIPQFLIGMYAAWKVGAVVVPCNPMFKQHELEFHLNDSGARGLICLESLFEAIVRDVIDNTKVEIIITTSELDYADQDPVPIYYARPGNVGSTKLLICLNY